MSDPTFTRFPNVRAKAAPRVTRWMKYRLLVLLITTGLICLFLQGYLTHPGLHVAGATVLLDLLLARYWWTDHVTFRRSTLAATILVATFVVASVVGLTAVLMNNDDPFAMTTGTIEGCLSVLLVIFTAF